MTRSGRPSRRRTTRSRTRRDCFEGAAGRSTRGSARALVARASAARSAGAYRPCAAASSATSGTVSASTSLPPPRPRLREDTVRGVEGVFRSRHERVQLDVVDQHPVQTLAAHRAYPSLRVRVRLRRLRCGPRCAAKGPTLDSLDETALGKVGELCRGTLSPGRMRESGVQRARRGQQAFHAAVLAVVLVVSAALVGFVHAGESEQPRAATVTAAVVPASMVPVVPDARPITKRTVGALFLLVAVVAALMLGVARRFSWSAAARAGSSAVPVVALSAARGRAPPRRTA